MIGQIKTLTDVTDRPLLGVGDALRLRQFLIDTYALLGREFNWETRRWEGTFWRVNEANPDYSTHSADTQVWENAVGELVGAVVLDGPRGAALQIHPDYRALEETMLIWAEENLSIIGDSGKRELSVSAFDWDEQRLDLLKQRGYRPDEGLFFQHRRRPASDPVPDLAPADGYTIRGLLPVESDTVGWMKCTNVVFEHTLPPVRLRNFQLYSPSHNYDLHIIAEAPDGTVAAFAGLTVDEANRTAVFEPVGTHPDHRRKGLARHCMYEALRRLQALGTADVVYVANRGNAPSAMFYAAIGFEHYTTSRTWVKQL